VRRALRIGALGALLGACSHHGAKVNETPTPAAAAAPTAPPPTEAAPVAVAPRPASHLAGMILPPSEIGAFRSHVAGCAAAPGGTAVADAAPARDLPAPEAVDAAGVATGLIVTHGVPHACCLTAKTTVRVDGTRVTIVDALEGAACRCRCRSTVRTAVGLGPGTYDVAVETSEAGGVREAWRGPVRVQ
jgi:hypothetical protein